MTEGGLHQLRHYYASGLAGSVDIKAPPEYLGQHDPSTTLSVCSHLMPSPEGRAVRAIEVAFASKSGTISNHATGVSSDT